jgi:nitrite reductase (NADH) small subunit/3-phenylpropionate/trans-cinnamate dioxygenase ferredoxin subunit
MAEYRTVARVADIPTGTAKTVAIGTKLVAIFHSTDGFFAIDDVCPHMGASLATGEVENGIVTCPWHAWRFRITDGTWADNPRIKIGCYPIRVVADEVQVEA